jgi:hypothetical protein
MKKTHWYTFLKAGILLVLLTLFSATVVSADSTPTVFYACVNNSSGTIHMITATGTCASSEQEIIWNNIGPQGPQGPQGDAGPQGIQGSPGPAGENGLSTVYTSTHIENSPTLVQVPVEVASLRGLPVGNYMVTALVSFRGGDVVTCQLSPDPTSMTASNPLTNGSRTLFVTLFVTDGVHITGGSIALQCSSEISTGFAVVNVSITAIAVDTIQTTP